MPMFGEFLVRFLPFFRCFGEDVSSKLTFSIRLLRLSQGRVSLGTYGRQPVISSIPWLCCCCCCCCAPFELYTDSLAGPEVLSRSSRSFTPMLSPSISTLLLPSFVQPSLSFICTTFLLSLLSQASTSLFVLQPQPPSESRRKTMESKEKSIER